MEATIEKGEKFAAKYGRTGFRRNFRSRYNIAYIRFRKKTTEVEAIRISDELVVDMTPDGKIYGIELLNANEQLQRDDTDNNLSVVNEATGKRIDVPLLMQ